MTIGDMAEQEKDMEIEKDQQAPGTEERAEGSPQEPEKEPQEAGPEETAEQISQYLYKTIEKLSKIDIDLLLDSRYNKFRKIGVYSEG